MSFSSIVIRAMSNIIKTPLAILGLSVAAVIPSLLAGELASSYIRLQNLTADPQNGDRYGSVQEAKREFVTNAVRAGVFIPSAVVGFMLMKKFSG